MKKEKRRPETQKALMRRITALVMGMWLLIMGLLTWAVAKDFYLQLEGQLFTWANTGVYFGFSEDYPADTPGLTESALIRTLGMPYNTLRAEQLLPIVKPHLPQSYGSDDWIWGKWDLLYGYEAAMMYRNDEGQTVMTSGNYVTFTYTDDQSWEAQKPEVLGCGYIDLDATEGCLNAFSRLLGDEPYGDHGISMLVDVLRMTGYFEGNQFYPVTVDRGYNMHPESDEESLSKLDAKGYINWTTIFTASQQPDRELVTVYGWDSYGIRCDYELVTAGSLLFGSQSGSAYYKSGSLLDAIIVSAGRKNIRINGTEQEFVCHIAVHCWPMGYAMWRLIPCYLVSLVLVIFLIRRFRWRIRRSLTIPLENAITGVEQWIRPDPWYEPKLVMEKFQKYQEDLHAAETENQQLRTALDYARSAEENRRQLISNLTHELKTPLAIVHGYAEGLKSGIAEDKKERYLDVILEESERMDAMVLQMLDLSRLEAGKVRLSADQVSLLALTRATVEKFAMAMEEKSLSVEFGTAEDFTIIADEQRITQVITNLMSNAVKYTENGGCIRIWIYRSANNARLEIENTSPPLPDEALKKLFDSFYRADPARTAPGTGLGLAIVKQIVELHRGTCTVRNKKYKTETAAQFTLTLPMS